MSHQPLSPGPSASVDQRALVFAIGHEVANHLGGIRLQAHLIDEDLDSLGLATTSVEIDTLAGRAAPLLALLRPILMERPDPGRPVAWASLLAGLRQQLADEGTRGVRVEIESPRDPSCRGPELEGLFNLMMALVGASMARLTSRQKIRIWIEERESETVFVLEDDGVDEDLSVGTPLRGRPLVVAVARCLLAAQGGQVEILREADKTRIELIFAN